MTRPTPNQIAKARKLWDMFPIEARDMSFEQFVQETVALSDPVQMQQDLMAVQLIKARGDSAKIKIDRALQRGR